MSRRFITAVALALTDAVLVGCAAPPYRLPGTETQPLSSLAIVRSGPRGATYLAAVDGEKVPHVFLPLDRWELSPGEHAVTVGLRTIPQMHADYAHLRFAALPGRTYVIQYEVKTSWGRGIWRGWIEDETGSTVSVPDTKRSSAVKK
jgi:hypothetical protein